MRYVALLRGINVGGRNIVRMEDLRHIFEGLGFERVTTYIQSGNVLFDSGLENTERLAATIEMALASLFSAFFVAVVLDAGRLESVVVNAPPGFGQDPAQYRYDVAFVKPPARAALILPTISLKAGVDEAFERNEVLYLRKLAIRASESRLPKLTANAAYCRMTIRNWKTMTELCRRIRTI